LHIGAGTKTGKSAALYCWLIEGLLSGDACCYCGSWFFRSKRAFDECKVLLQPFIARRVVRVNEARLQLTTAGGGYLDFTSADNPMASFGSNYNRIVIDEASRCPQAIYPAALTTISATNGRLRTAFNLELGSRNWAIANLLRVQRMSPEERARTGEDFLTFPSGGDGLVSPEIIELMRSQMPLPLWEALYLGKIPESDASLFRNLDRIFTGAELEAPRENVRYFLAADLARKQDWTVVTVISEDGQVVATDRFNQISWSLQVERVGLWYRTFRCVKVMVDASGVGDPIAEELEKAGMTVEPFVFTVPSRRALIEELVVACDNQEISIPASAKFQVYKEELESMEYQLDGTTVRYAVPANMHDDAVMSLALATRAFRASRGMVLGVLDFFKRLVRDVRDGIRDAYGELIHKPEPPSKPVPIVVEAKTETRVEGLKAWLEGGRAPACAACGSKSTIFIAGPRVHCNQCACDSSPDGRKVVSQPTEMVVGVNCCSSPLLQTAGGTTRCGNCGKQTQPAGIIVGMSRAQYQEQRRGYGRFN